MFKSKFANALSVVMAGSLGMAAVEGKLSVGYGAEAGAMDEGLAHFVRKHCGQSLVICRNDPSRKVLEALGVRTKGRHRYSLDVRASACGRWVKRSCERRAGMACGRS